MRKISEDIIQRIERALPIQIEMLQKPISEQNPCGEYLKYENLYFQIEQARLSEDSSLPQGVWGHDLKQSDWRKVIDLCCSALQKDTKDLQIAMWLLEASVHRYGLEGFIIGISIADMLSQNFWDDIHPQIEHDDIEYRINPLAWAAQKLTPTLRLIPLIENPNEDSYVTWDDWLRSHTEPDKHQNDPPHLTSDMILHLLSRTKSEDIDAFLQTISETKSVLESFLFTLNHACQEHAPSFSAVFQYLSEVSEFMEAELQGRGYLNTKKTEESQEELSDTENDEHVFNDTIINTNRNGTYKQVELAARALLQFDPHSPAPYLILQACRWGTMDTRELYRELFVEHGGQLNIFDLLGVESPQTQNHS